MLRSDVLELVDELLRLTLKKSKPFGGMQVIFSGDFMQLPPVVKKDEELPLFWAFQSEVWEALNLDIVNLTEIKRQDDPEFAKALNAVRAGWISRSIDQYFKASAKHVFPEGVEPVKLLSTNQRVDSWNKARLSSLPGELKIMRATIWGKDEYTQKKVVKECIAMEELELKAGCQVMMLKNHPEKKYVNGSMGELEGFGRNSEGEQVLIVRIMESGETVQVAEDEWEIEEPVEGQPGRYRVAASFIQYPVKLGYAITIHKSQGMSIDFLEVDLGRCFADGMAYVALSRARTYKGLRVLNFSRRAVRCNKEAFDYYMNLKNEGVI